MDVTFIVERANGDLYFFFSNFYELLAHFFIVRLLKIAFVRFFIFIYSKILNEPEK